MHLVEQADHAFQVPVSGWTDSDLVDEIADAFAVWMAHLAVTTSFPDKLALWPQPSPDQVAERFW